MLLIALFIPALLFTGIREKIYETEKNLLARMLVWLISFVVINGLCMAIFFLKYRSTEVGTYLIIDESAARSLEYLSYGILIALAEILLELVFIKERFGQFLDSKYYASISDRLVFEFGKTNDRKRSFVIFYVIFSLLIFLCYALKWEQINFGNVDINGIIFTLKMPLVGAQKTFYEGIFTITILPTIIWTVLFAVINAMIRKVLERNGIIGISLITVDVKRATTEVMKSAFIIWSLVLAFVANSKLGLTNYLFNRLQQSKIIQTEYVSPNEVTITFPEKKRNLIYIYVESLESSLQDKAAGGLFEDNYIPELTQLARENISFSQSDLIEGAAVAPACGWTIAGMVAESSGLPLKLFAYDDNSVDNSMDKYAYFLPGITSLGDILDKEGYINYFMCGSDLTFGGRTAYLLQHGNYQYFDYYTAIEEGKIAEDYYVWWGFEDLKLYEFAKEKITMLADSGQPFNFSMLTVDTHNGGGYICEACRRDYSENYANIFACSSRQVSSFVEWIKEQDFYENTTIIICGDHCSMDGDFFSGYSYDKHSGETVRKVYNVIINAPLKPVKEKYRKFTTMDMFPTTLAAIGAQIEGDRLGLGTDLFSERETLAEQYGYEELFKDLDRSSDFYNDTFLYPDIVE